MGSPWVWLVSGSLVLGACTASVDASPHDSHVAEQVAGVEPVSHAGDDILQATSSLELDVIPAGAAFIARPSGDAVTLFRNLDGDVLDSRQASDDRGVATTFAVVGDPSEDWIEVLIDARPNFTTAWVRAEHVDLTWTTLRIVVERDERRLTLYDGDDVVTHGTVAIGTSATPTPKGRTYVSELLASTEPDSLYGPFALGLALYSEEVTEYAGGDGQIGIHGTNRPDLLGERASLGCVRVHNDLISELAGRVPLGTPVDIV